MISSVLVDLDGTVIDSAPVIGTVLNKLRRGRGQHDLPLSDFRSLVGLGPTALVATALELELGDVPEAIQEFRILYAKMPTSKSSLNAGAARMFEDLNNIGISIGLVSNKPEYLCRKLLLETDILRWFDTIVGGDTISWCKPSAEPLLRALSDLNANSDNALYVGDTSIDQLAAESAGVRFVYYNSNYDDSVARHSVWASISRLDQLVNIVKGENDLISQ